MQACEQSSEVLSPQKIAHELTWPHISSLNSESYIKFSIFCHKFNKILRRNLKTASFLACVKKVVLEVLFSFNVFTKFSVNLLRVKEKKIPFHPISLEMFLPFSSDYILVIIIDYSEWPSINLGNDCFPMPNFISYFSHLKLYFRDKKYNVLSQGFIYI